ncbi:unnamed protein product [Closterium sp. Naga37s-1]|nr:unnamed protein product [Closterium sp. Naga37s-1]
MEWLTSVEGLNVRQELEKSVREHHPYLRDEEVDLIAPKCCYKQITSDASAFSGAVNSIVATTGVNGKEGKGGREQTDKKDGKWEKKRAPFKGRCYNCNEEGHMAAKCPNKKKDATPAATANVAEGDGKGVALTVACSAAKLLADDKDLWFLDSGCSQHMTGRKEWFTVIRDPSTTKSVKGFDGSMQEVAGVALGQGRKDANRGRCHSHHRIRRSSGCNGTIPPSPSLP